jgi:hypothetical protein
MHRTLRTLAVASLLVVSALSASPVAAAEPPPANDSIAGATVIGSLPFVDTIDTTAATAEPADPPSCWWADFGRDSATVWYAWTAPASGPIGAATWGSDYDTTISVGTSDGAGGIDVLACNDDTRSLQAAVRFDAVAGQTYLIAIGASPWAETAGGELVFSLDVGPAAQAADVEFDPDGSFVKGTVRFSGTVSCAAEAGLSSLLVVELSQFGSSRETAAGTAFLDIAGCPGEDIPFEIEVPATFGHFHPGVGVAQVIWVACNDFECANETIDLTVSIGA